jgi:YD repeat-containing protein
LFDKDGNVTGTLDPCNQLTQFVFDNAGREIRTTDPTGNKATTPYYQDGNVSFAVASAQFGP